MARRRLPLSGPLLGLSTDLRKVARTQGGVVTADLDPGFPRPTVDAAHHAQSAALLASLARPAVVSHLSAVRLLGLPPATRTARRPG